MARAKDHRASALFLILVLLVGTGVIGMIAFKRYLATEKSVEMARLSEAEARRLARLLREAQEEVAEERKRTAAESGGAAVDGARAEDDIEEPAEAVKVVRGVDVNDPAVVRALAIGNPYCRPAPSKARLRPSANGMVGVGTALIHAIVPKPLGSNALFPVYFRIDPAAKPTTDFAGKGKARDTSAAGQNSASIEFDPEEALTLGPGNWWIEIPVTLRREGIAIVEVCYEMDFPSANVGRAEIESIASPVTLLEWDVGVHTSKNADLRLVRLSDKKCEFAIEPLTDGNLGETVAPEIFVAVENEPADLKWTTPPSVRQSDAGDGGWIATLLPDRSIRGAITIVAGKHELTVPFTFKKHPAPR